MTDGVADKTDRLQPGKCHVYNVLCVFVADGRRKYKKISRITLKTEVMMLNILVSMLLRGHDDKPKKRKTQRKADLRRRTVFKSLLVKE
jgi:hypothetical protein